MHTNRDMILGYVGSMLMGLVTIFYLVGCTGLATDKSTLQVSAALGNPLTAASTRCFHIAYLSILIAPSLLTCLFPAPARTT